MRQMNVSMSIHKNTTCIKNEPITLLSYLLMGLL